MAKKPKFNQNFSHRGWVVPKKLVEWENPQKGGSGGKYVPNGDDHAFLNERGFE